MKRALSAGPETKHVNSERSFIGDPVFHKGQKFWGSEHIAGAVDLASVDHLGDGSLTAELSITNGTH